MRVGGLRKVVDFVRKLDEFFGALGYARVGSEWGR